MIRSFEPEVDHCWPVSAPSDHYQCSRTMDESVFSLRSPSLLNNMIGNSTESPVRSSSIASELERLNSFNSFNANFINVTSQDCKSFHFESSSPSLSLNQLPGQTFLTVNPMELRASGFTCHQDQANFETKKRRKPSTVHNQRECKRFKAERDNKLQDLPMSPTMKASSLKKSQKLGDKITALQQLVSPFGKTDTASVLQEACVQINVLHKQLRVLSSSYFGAKTSHCFQGNIAEEKLSLKRKDLCLVPMSSIMKLSDQESNR